MNVFTRLDVRDVKKYAPRRALIGVGVVRVGRFDAGASDESAKSIFAAGAALGSDNEAVTVDDHVNGISVGLIHGGEIGVFHHDDLAVARMLLEIFFDGFPGFADVDGEEDEAFAGELMADLVDEGGFVGAEAATLPWMVSLENFSPVVVMALKCGAGSLSLGPARVQTAARIRRERIIARNEMFFAAMGGMYTAGASTCQLLCWQVVTRRVRRCWRSRNTKPGTRARVAESK